MNWVVKSFALLLGLGTLLPPAIVPAAFGQITQHNKSTVLPIAAGGKLKMLYDARQRPQTVLMRGRVYIVFNGDAQPSKNGNGSAYPMLAIYDIETREFSQAVRLSDKRSTDHHDSPIIWADKNKHLHVLFGCHKTPGTHLVSVSPASEAGTELAWREATQIAPKLSYPSVFRIAGDRELIYYRTDGHTSSWTYRISDDCGQSWVGPPTDVTDLDCKGRLDWSSYQTKIASSDGSSLHVVFTDYDDNKHSPTPERFYNPRYGQEVSNEWKYNLSYLRIDLQTQQAYNSTGKLLTLPIDIAYSKEHCEIWDTDFRGAGVPPAVALNQKGEPGFLHVLSGATVRNHHYFYVRKVDGEWLKTPIVESNHQWNSGHLSCDAEGRLHAFVIVGPGYLEGGYMDKHGGGQIEEWISEDNGESWRFRRKVSPTAAKYEGWRFNNVQPVIRSDNTQVEGMFVFYGWKSQNDPDAVAFLFHER